MADGQHAFLSLACVPCRRVVKLAALPGDLAAGRSNFDEYRLCAGCGKEMVETNHGDCGHLLLPGEDCTCRS